MPTQRLCVGECEIATVGGARKTEGEGQRVRLERESDRRREGRGWKPLQEGVQEIMDG